VIGIQKIQQLTGMSEGHQDPQPTALVRQGWHDRSRSGSPADVGFHQTDRMMVFDPVRNSFPVPHNGLRLSNLAASPLGLKLEYCTIGRELWLAGWSSINMLIASA
jgi:hypothetical protein